MNVLFTIAKVVLLFEPTKGFSVFCLITCIIGEFFVSLQTKFGISAGLGPVGLI